ncbi:MAG: hypothetical protein QOD67_4681 [Caballeronia sp.]|nr:hypothetical protein [Caballeronia sp.]
MHTSNCSSKTQAEPVPRRHMRLRTRTPVKRPKHRFALARINTRSGVGNLRRGKTIAVPNLERALPSPWRELQRIVEQVLDGPEQQVVSPMTSTGPGACTFIDKPRYSASGS